MEGARVVLVIHGGAGLFTGRFLLVPAHIERMQNGFTGLIIQQRLSGIALGIPALAIDPASPATTGIALPRDANRNADIFVSPYAKQATAGYTTKLGSTGLFADFDPAPRDGASGSPRRGASRSRSSGPSSRSPGSSSRSSRR